MGSRFRRRDSSHCEAICQVDRGANCRAGRESNCRAGREANCQARRSTRIKDRVLTVCILVRFIKTLTRRWKESLPTPDAQMPRSLSVGDEIEEDLDDFDVDIDDVLNMLQDDDAPLKRPNASGPLAGQTIAPLVTPTTPAPVPEIGLQEEQKRHFRSRWEETDKGWEEELDKRDDDAF